MHFLNLFLSWSTLNGKLPSSHLWRNSLSTFAHMSAFFKFFSCSWKSTSSYRTRYYISLLQIIDISLFPFVSPSLPILFLRAAHFTLSTNSDTSIRFIWNSLFFRYLENSCRTMQVNISLKKLGKRRWSYCHRHIPLLLSFWENRVNICVTTPFFFLFLIGEHSK